MFYSLFLILCNSAIDAPFFLVAMIVFITPTANNVMVMVELAGLPGKEGMALAIGYQYAAAPIFLTFSLTAVVAVASSWDHSSPLM